MTSLRLALASLFVGSLALAGCETPPVVDLGQPLSQGAATVTVTGYEVTYLELETESGAEITDAPVMLVNVDVTNTGASPLQYDLAWTSASLTQAQAPLLFVYAGEDAPTSAVSANGIASTNLGDRDYLADPIDSVTSIGPGETVQDVLLFEVPPAGTSRLVLSMPPRLFGAEVEMPGYVAFSYNAPADVAPPAPVAMGHPFVGDSFSLTVQSATFDYVRMTNSSEGEGFSNQPLLQVQLTLQNTSDQTIRYTPPTLSSPIDPPELTDAGGGAVPMATFDANITIEGQAMQQRQLGPGESLTDTYYFTRPAAGGTLHLRAPGKRFGGHGLVQIDIPYTPSNPPEPPELTLPEPEPTTPPTP